MSGPRSELRRWRAWACFHLAEQNLGAEGFPRDQQQIAQEGIHLPGQAEVLAQLGQWGLVGEGELVAEIWAGGG